MYNTGVTQNTYFKLKIKEFEYFISAVESIEIDSFT